MRNTLIGSVVAVFVILAVVGCAARRESLRGERQSRIKERAREAAAGKAPGSSSEKAPGGPRATRQIIVYFADEMGQHLVPEVYEITTTAVARAAIERLIAGPRDPHLHPTIPKGTRLLDLDLDQTTALANFSHEFREAHSGGSAGEVLTVFSIVNSLTEFSTIERVRFLIEGKPIDTLAGHVDLSEPVGRAPALIRQ